MELDKKYMWVGILVVSIVIVFSIKLYKTNTVEHFRPLCVNSRACLYTDTDPRGGPNCQGIDVPAGEYPDFQSYWKKYITNENEKISGFYLKGNSKVQFFTEINFQGPMLERTVDTPSLISFEGVYGVPYWNDNIKSMKVFGPDGDFTCDIPPPPPPPSVDLNCTYTPWENDGTCQGKCGEDGIQKQKRRVDQPQCTGGTCDEPLERSVPCKMDPCPIPPPPPPATFDPLDELNLYEIKRTPAFKYPSFDIYGKGNAGKLQKTTFSYDLDFEPPRS